MHPSLKVLHCAIHMELLWLKPYMPWKVPVQGFMGTDALARDCICVAQALTILSDFSELVTWLLSLKLNIFQGLGLNLVHMGVDGARPWHPLSSPLSLPLHPPTWYERHLAHLGQVQLFTAVIQALGHIH